MALLDQRSPREEGERLQYRIRRYLSGATEAELSERLSDIAANLFTFTEDAKVGLITSEIRDIWLSRLVHLNLEHELRRRDIFDYMSIPEFTFTKENLDKFSGQSHIFSRPIDRGVFCRYSDIQWIEELRDEGSIFLRPASYYSDSNLDPARRDDEMVFRTYVCPHDYDLGMIDPFFREILPERCWTKIDHQKPSKHYLYSISTGFHIRLFADFKANACLIINNQDEFERRLIAGTQAALPGWSIKFGPAMYMDPYFIIQRLPNAENEMFFMKHARYTYQHEFRLVALPPPGFSGPLPDLKFAIGSLKDISEIERLVGHPFAAA